MNSALKCSGCARPGTAVVEHCSKCGSNCCVKHVEFIDGEWWCSRCVRKKRKAAKMAREKA